MKLSFEQIKEFTTGAARIQEENSMLSFKRFTQQQEELYKSRNENFYNKTFCTAGIKFLFKTDSRNLFLKVKTVLMTSQKYFSVDVFVNGKLIGYIDNFSDVELPQNYTKVDVSLGDFS